MGQLTTRDAQRWVDLITLAHQPVEAILPCGGSCLRMSSALGSVLAALGRLTAGIGLAG